MKTTLGGLRYIIQETYKQNICCLDESLKDKFKKFIQIIPLCTLTFACNIKPNAFDAKGFTNDELIVMQDAADEWCEQTGNIHCAVIGHDGDSSIEIVAKITKCQDNKDPNLDSIGCWKLKDSHDTGNIYVKDLRKDPDWYLKLNKIVKHELGHHFAYKKTRAHLGDGNIMAPSLEQQPTYLTQKDVEYVNSDKSAEEITNEK